METMVLNSTLQYNFSVKSITRNNLTNQGNFENYDFPFDPKDYSLFKYGSARLTKQFAEELALGLFQSEEFQDLLPKMIAGVQVIVYPSAYNFIPAASSALLECFVEKFHELIYPISDNIKPLQIGRMFWDYQYLGEYGAMNRADRDKCIPIDGFEIDAEFAKGKIMMFFDDIRITGSHEGRIHNVLQRNNMNNECWFIQYASLANPEQCDSDAGIENFLNYAMIKNLEDFNEWTTKEEFHFNARNVRYVMIAKKEAFVKFVNSRTLEYNKQLFNLAVGNGYRDLEPCVENIQYLYKLITK